MKESWSNLRFCPSICLGLKKPKKTLRIVGVPIEIRTRYFAKYKSEALPLELNRSVHAFLVNNLIILLYKK
jgi:uncharacterized protein YbbK (DUF523 family)